MSWLVNLVLETAYPRLETHNTLFVYCCHGEQVASATLETLSIDDGNGNGDGKTEERLRRGRGCVAKLETVKQAQYDDSFPRRGLNRMGAFHSPKIFDLNFRKLRSRMERVYSRSVSTFREQLKRLS